MLPAHLKKRIPKAANIARLRKFIGDPGIHTVCESLKCPNIGECYSNNSLTFMILGDVCTRNCAFCGCEKGLPALPDPDESQKVRAAALKLGLKHVVVTSVTRDDLPDGGAGHFADVIRNLRQVEPRRLAVGPGSEPASKPRGSEISVEVLIPDFQGREEFLEIVIAAGPDVVNHNVETVPRLYPSIRPQADYARSLALLRTAKALAPSIYTKSGIMVGLGESDDEVLLVLRDIKSAGCDIVTIGQYLPPF